MCTGRSGGGGNSLGVFTWRGKDLRERGRSFPRERRVNSSSERGPAKVRTAKPGGEKKGPLPPVTGKKWARRAPLKQKESGEGRTSFIAEGGCLSVVGGPVARKKENAKGGKKKGARVTKHRPSTRRGEGETARLPNTEVNIRGKKSAAELASGGRKGGSD